MTRWIKQKPFWIFNDVFVAPIYLHHPRKYYTHRWTHFIQCLFFFLLFLSAVVLYQHRTRDREKFFFIPFYASFVSSFVIFFLIHNKGKPRGEKFVFYLLMKNCIFTIFFIPQLFMWCLLYSEICIFRLLIWFYIIQFNCFFFFYLV